MAYTTIEDPSAHFQIALYTGNGNDDKNIPFGSANYTDEYVGQEIQGDWFWFKRTDSGTDHWEILDTTRGNGKISLKTSSADTENDDDVTNDNTLKSIGSNDVTFGTDPQVNRSGEPYVAYIWKYNGGTRTTFTESSNNPGGGRQVNATAGLSMIDYTGTGGAGTLAHGLGVAPNFIIAKGRSVGEHWTVTMMNVANSPIDETDRIKLDVAETAQDNSVYWNDTAATSTNVTVGSGDATNKDGDTFIMYAFANIKGFSKAGHYKGNGSADGPFINLGFRPAWVMVKQTTTANRDWRIIDAARSPFNLADDEIHPNDNNAVTTSGMQLNLTANGFKIKTTSTACNSNGDSYIYLAFAQHPFVTSSGVPVGAK